MGSISAGDLILLRDRQSVQRTEERLYIWGFPNMWRGELNEPSVIRGQQTLICQSGAMQGDFAFADMTKGLMVWFGNSAGSDDLGRRLLLSISGTASTPTMVLDWYDDMDLSAAVGTVHITVIHFRPPWPKLAWFTAGDGFYKSGPPSGSGGAGIAYSDQNEEPPPQVVMGRCAVVTTGDTFEWWLTSGVIPSDIVAVYQAANADSLSSSYTNLANPGTYTLAPGVAPSWSASTGWTFNGSTQYLTTGITPSSNWTIIVSVRVAAASGLANVAIGQAGNPANNTANQALGVAPAAPDEYLGLWGTSLLADGEIGTYSVGDTTVLANAGGVLYVNGAQVLDLTGGFSYTGAPTTFYIGGVNAAEAYGFGWNDRIFSVAIYNTQLTPTQISAITTQMADLSQVSISVDATDSQPVSTGATISSYAWSATPAGASFANPSAAATTVTLPSGERYYISCSVTDSNGKLAIGYRPVIADGGTLAIAEFTRSAITEQYNNFNVGCSFTITSPDIDWSDIQSGVMVIVTADDFFGTTEKNISFRDDSRYDDRLNILYWGFVTGEVRNYGGDTSSIQLACVNSLQFFLYSLSITGVRTPTKWYEMSSDLMYVAALLFHLFKYHSTLLEISDWILPWTDTILRSSLEEWTEGGIMERARSFAGPHGRLMAITATSQGEFFVEEDANLISEADRNTLTTTLSMANDDVEQTSQVNINHFPQVSQVYLSGGSSDGVMGSFEPFLSQSQNVRKARGTGAQPFERVMLPSQDETNRLCGRILAVLNREKVDINFSFAGTYREVFSPAGSQWTNTGTEVFAATEVTNLRSSTDLNSIRLIPRQVAKNPPSDGLGSTDVAFDIEAPAGELEGRTITLLPVEPFYVPANANTSPPLLGEPIDTLIVGDDTDGVEVYIFDDATWASRNTGLTGDLLKVRDLKVVPYWWIFQNSTDHENAMVWIATDGGIRFSDDFGKSWQDRTPLAALDSAPAGVTPLTVAYYSIDVYSVPTDINRTITAMCREEVTGTIHSWLLISTNSGFSWTSSKRS